MNRLGGGVGMGAPGGDGSSGTISMLGLSVSMGLRIRADDDASTS